MPALTSGNNLLVNRKKDEAGESEGGIRRWIHELVNNTVIV